MIGGSGKDSLDGSTDPGVAADITTVGETTTGTADGGNAVIRLAIGDAPYSVPHWPCGSEFPHGQREAERLLYAR